MRHIEAYTAGGDAYERGEPAQPPVTIPRQRRDAWLKGWPEQKAFMERQAAGRKQELPAAAAAPLGCQWPLGERPFTPCGAPVLKQARIARRIPASPGSGRPHDWAVNDRATDPRAPWRSYGTDPLPSGQEALDEPFRAFPSWFLRIECDRRGKVSTLNEAHTAGRRREMPLRALLARMRHDGCGGLPGQAELLTSIESASAGSC